MKTYLLPLAAAVAAACVLAGCATAPPAPVVLNLVAFNDFHGNLEASRFNYTSAATGKAQARAGGVETLAAALQAWRKEDGDLLLVSAGDLVGASPALSSMWADEPAIEAMNMLGLRASALGNHEFDAGRVELLRQQNGGCNSPRPAKACKIAPQFGGAKFTYLAQNVTDSVTGKLLVPGFRIEDVKGVKVGLVGAVLKGTASVAVSTAIAGLSFGDEAEAINRAIPLMRAQGAKVFVALIHEGGETDEPFDKPGCSKLAGGVVDIVKRLDPAVRLVITGHSHTGYNCMVDGRVVTQAASAGHLLSRISMKVDPASGAVAAIDARNVLMTPGTYPADARMDAWLATVRERSRAALARPVATLGAPTIARRSNEAGESPLGNVIADAVLAATRDQGAQIGFMNTGGIRKDLDAGSDLVATFGQAQAVLPFGNTLVLMDLTGAQLRALLEQQWARPAASSDSVLQVSQGFSYRWDASQPKGGRVVPGSVRLNGVALDDARHYRVVANNFLAEGGDNFPEFAKGVNRVDSGLIDLDAVIAYLSKNAGTGAATAGMAPSARIEKVAR
ncbi:MAG TPA: bifunctional metallophosphatase/5'-nucleotidase [Telluria sp.]